MNIFLTLKIQKSICLDDCVACKGERAETTVSRLQRRVSSSTQIAVRIKLASVKKLSNKGLNQWLNQGLFSQVFNMCCTAIFFHFSLENKMLLNLRKSCELFSI